GAAVSYLRPTAEKHVEVAVPPIPPTPTPTPEPPPHLPTPPINAVKTPPFPGSTPPPIPRGPLTAGEIAAVVSRANRNILECFERHRTALPSKEGQLSVQVTVAATGAVSDAHVITPGLESGNLADCVTGRVRSLKFRPSDRELRVNLPFAYRSEE